LALDRRQQQAGVWRTKKMTDFVSAWPGGVKPFSTESSSEEKKFHRARQLLSAIVGWTAAPRHVKAVFGHPQEIAESEEGSSSGPRTRTKTATRNKKKFTSVPAA
jgi:hypothetical protein